MISKKSRLATLLLCLFLGGIGAHRFYVGKPGTALLTIVTCFGFLGIWPLIDAVRIAFGIFTDREGLAITKWE